MEVLRADVKESVCCLPRAVTRVPALSLKDAADLSTLAAMCPMPFQRKELRHGLREVAYSFRNRRTESRNAMERPTVFLATAWLVLAMNNAPPEPLAEGFSLLFSSGVGAPKYNKNNTYYK